MPLQGPQAQNQPATNPQPTQAEQNAMQQQFLGYLNMLVEKAASDADPALYADLILDNMDESMVREFVARPDTLQLLTTYNPKVAQFVPWFKELKSCLVEGLTNQQESADNPSQSEPGTTNAPTDPPEGVFSGN